MVAVKRGVTKSKENLTADKLKQIMKRNGFHDIKEVSSTKFALLVASTGIRKSSLERLQNILKKDYNVRYDKSTTFSSIGHLVIEDKFQVTAKPKNRQGASSAGVDNEIVLVEEINKAVKDSDDKMIDVIFKHGAATFKIANVTEAVRAGADTAGRKKSDVNIITNKGKSIPISIKKDNAENWESADSYWGQTARLFVDAAVNANMVKLEKEGGIFKLSPNLAVKSTKEEKTNVVFGSDILAGKGAVIKKTFARDDFRFDGKKNSLSISVGEIIRSLSDVEGSPSDVWFLIRNDRTRLGSPIGYPGLRVLAVYASRVNQNVKKLNRNMIK
jgi:hypothetical protein